MKIRVSNNWSLDGINISHNVIDYSSFGKNTFSDNDELVRLHFGLKGSYDFDYLQLDNSFTLSGHHNNIMYSKGMDIEVRNRSKEIATFGINFSPDAFLKIAQNGNEKLKRFSENIIRQKNTIFSKRWETNNIKIQGVINEIINCAYTDALHDLFLLSKSIELLVYQADIHQSDPAKSSVCSAKDKRLLFEAKEFLDLNFYDPPTIIELSKQIGINEYKLKKGFKELFGTTVFGYIHHARMELASRLLLDSQKTAKEIAYDIGYSSPQHFSNAFKKHYGITPNSVRKNPDSTIKNLDVSSSLAYKKEGNNE
jgi:AraC-like DNA-binding protein